MVHEKNKNDKKDNSIYSIDNNKQCANVIPGCANVIPGCANVIPGCANVISGRANVIPECANVIIDNEEETAPQSSSHKCSACYRMFVNERNLKKHVVSCKKINNPNECMFCHKIINSRNNKSRHQSTCSMRNTLALVPDSTNTTNNNITNNNNNNNNITNNNTTNNTVNVTNIIVPMPFSLDDDEFRFKVDHLSKSDFKQIWDQPNPEIGFRRFFTALWEKPENRVVKKTTHKDKYNHVHIGNNKWSLEQDKMVFPKITQELSSAALENVNEHTKMKMENVSVHQILKYLDKVNTEEEPEVSDAVCHVKSLVINLTRQILEQEQEQTNAAMIDEKE